jgi:hypothetical protein
MRTARGPLFRAAPSVLLVAGLGLAISGCSAAVSPPPAMPAPGTSAAPATLRLGPPFRSADGYQISVPEGWMHYPIPASEGASVSFTSMALDQGAIKPFADSLDVAVGPTAQALEAVVAEHSAKAAKLAPHFRVLSDRPTVLPVNLPARLIEVAFELPNLGPQRALQLLTVRSGKSYVVTITAAPGTFDRLRDQFEKCVVSLRFA